jgi:hypothetical protein
MGNSAGGAFLPGDPPPSTNQVLTTPTMFMNTAAMTVTGATGSTAAAITIAAPGFITLTGAASSGVNLPVPLGGEMYIIKNLVAGAVNVYCLSGSIFATGSITGATGFSISNTGSKGAVFMAVVPSVWQVVPLIT